MHARECIRVGKNLRTQDWPEYGQNLNQRLAAGNPDKTA
jgi:hypothetical protein